MISDHKSSERRCQSSGYEDPSKGSDTTEGGSSSSTRRMSTRLIHSCLSVKETFRKLSSNPQFKALEQIGALQKILYGLDFYSRESIHPRILCGVNRSQRCIPSHTHQHSVSEISHSSSKYGGTDSSFEIPSPSFWPFIGLLHYAFRLSR